MQVQLIALAALIGFNAGPSLQSEGTVLRTGKLGDFQWYRVSAPSGASVYQSGSTTVQTHPFIVRYLVFYSQEKVVQLHEARCSDNVYRSLGADAVAADSSFTIRQSGASATVWHSTDPDTDFRELVDGACT